MAEIGERANTVVPKETDPLEEEIDIVLTLVEWLTNDKVDIKTRYEQFKELETGFSEKIRAIIKYCTDYEFKPGTYNEKIAKRHDPIDVFMRLTAFEQATMDRAKVVLLPPSNYFGGDMRTPYLLEGAVEYTLNHFYNYWQVTIGGSEAPRLEVGNLYQAIHSAEEWKERRLAIRDIAHTPLVGFEAVMAYLSSNIVDTFDKREVRALLKR